MLILLGNFEATVRRFGWCIIENGLLRTPNLANFLRILALPAEVAQWSLSTLRDRLVKIGAKIVRHGRSITFQMAEVMVPRALFQKILAAIAALRPLPPARC